MKTRFLAASLVIIPILTLFCDAVQADALTGFSDITVAGNAIVRLRYAGTEYVAANGDLMLGTTTRWYIPAAAGVPTLWRDGDPAPAATVPTASDPKTADVGANADDWILAVSGAVDGMSSLDGINFQETIFPLPTDTIFVFERGGNDTGTFQAILMDGSLGTPVAFNGANVYKDTGFDVGGQHAFGVVFTTGVRVKGVRITAPGHDCLSISALPRRSDPKQSQNPQPQDTATDVHRDAVLGWGVGEGAAAHDVYLGTSFEDVDTPAGPILVAC